MKVSRFSEQQNTFILKQVDDGAGIEDVCRKAGVSQQTYYRWRKKYSGLGDRIDAEQQSGLASRNGR
ncbi:transposase [Aestuariivirga sp.]|uniref:transposase n=1 Tax=Aestuariivirga sp. TaxID=2650926 RepID=UPI003BAD7787